ncbi:hypothetical protein POJ06DRAFT_279192 [Lipomyces tetrasporus]|uniref:Uncharacterized protein n=1 Tax=Lipomyces tetrasporus TaxID=54092 RepID=A0AAD7QXQ3_9ASCO|nr:uncharacterized protein POJ06DRAFT_279192 [Lipomyces tetrasporus]KAJ8103377.1 hypothetical protein POJ06DRAFT_279192 [Lipomyces tetrasporus]
MDRHTATDDLLDHITEFEILCSQDSWPDETKASLFLETLTPGLKSSIRRSDVDLEAYEKRGKRTDITAVATPHRIAAGELRTVGSSNPRTDYLRKGLDTWPRIALGPRALPSRQQSGSLQSKFLLTSAITARKTQSLTDHFRRGCERPCIFGGSKDTRR